MSVRLQNHSLGPGTVTGPEGQDTFQGPVQEKAWSAFGNS